MKLWGQNYTRRGIEKYVGDISQVCGVRRCILDDGPGRGMRVFDVRSGGGLTFSVLPDRGMDIGWCHFNDIPIGFISKTGMVAPQLCEYPGLGFMRGFTGGLLTTCGYTHMGAACVDEGKPLGLHGRATALPAENALAESYWEDGEYVLRMSGRMREAEVFGENIQFHREIKVMAGENRIVIRDELTNCGFEPQPLMLLYHVNFGHPLVGPETELLLSNATGVTPRDAAAKPGVSACKAFQEPAHQYKEQVFYHHMLPDSDGMAYAALRNKALDVCAKVKFSMDELPYLIQWKQMGEGDYVCGIEPATWRAEGREKARKQGELQMLAPDESRRFHVEISVGTGV